MLAAQTSLIELTADGVSRRDLLRLGGISAFRLKAAEGKSSEHAPRATARRCIFLLLTGGPSQIDTLDPKPLAPAEIRGPFRAVSTPTPGVAFSEVLPMLAERAHKFAVVRSLSHDAAPLHETCQQFIQTGRLARRGLVPPSVGSLVARLLGSHASLPPYVVLPRPLEEAGSTIWLGQGAGDLGSQYEPYCPAKAVPPASEPAQSSPAAGLTLFDPDGDAAEINFEKLAAAACGRNEPEAFARAYGETEFGRSCLMARRLSEAGVRFVTVNMFDSLTGKVTWDCHANPDWAPATLADYRAELCPAFDRALAALVDDLEVRGLLQETLVVALGEFGRQPRINERGGRDHWTGVWSGILVGAGIPGGTVVGASDARGAVPAERPVAPAELAATILHLMGVDLQTEIPLAGGGFLLPAPGEPIAELVGRP
jgi:hypothetical protein